jgi:hypothetical protein
MLWHLRNLQRIKVDMEEWRSIGSGMFGGMSMQRPIATAVPNFDPVALMMKKKQQQEDPTNFPVVNHDENDINELESFCRKYGIIGFNCGRMSPKAALRMLKMRMGIPNEEKQIVENKSLLKG